MRFKPASKSMWTSTSFDMVAAFGLWHSHSLWKPVGLHGETHFVIRWFGNVGEIAQQAKGLKDRCVYSDADGVISALYAKQCGSARECPVGEHLRRQVATAPGIANVAAKFAKSLANCNGWVVRSWHFL